MPVGQIAIIAPASAYRESLVAALSASGRPVTAFDQFSRGDLKAIADCTGVIFAPVDEQTGVDVSGVRKAIWEIMTYGSVCGPFFLAVQAHDGTVDDLLEAGCDDVIPGAAPHAKLMRRLAGLDRVGVMRRELVRRRLTAALFETDADDVQALEFDLGNRPSRSETIATTVVNLSGDPAAANALEWARRFSRMDFATADEAFHWLYTHKADICVIVADAQGDATRAMLSELRNSPTLFNVPVLVLAGESSQCPAADWYVEGATDVAALNLGADELEAHLDFAVRLERMRRQVSEGFNTRTPLIARDPVSGLYSNGFVISHLERMRSDMGVTFDEVAIALVTLTGLERVNHTVGFHAGDHVVHQLGRLIQRCLRMEDVAGRYGSESFLLVFPETRPAQARVALNRLSNLLRMAMVKLPDGATVSVQASIQQLTWSCDQSVNDLDVHLRTAGESARRIA